MSDLARGKARQVLSLVSLPQSNHMREPFTDQLLGEPCTAKKLLQLQGSEHQMKNPKVLRLTYT
jgi:hypothetical protein